MEISEDDIKRFWSSIDIALDSGCWEWQRGKITSGYGVFYLSNWRRMYAHRFSYIAFCGEIPADMVVCHSCDNPSCVNPAHLWLGKQGNNVRDCVAKGRDLHAVGENHGRAKLNESAVREIRRRANGGAWGIQSRLAEEYGVARVTIRQIIAGNTWTHVK